MLVLPIQEVTNYRIEFFVLHKESVVSKFRLDEMVLHICDMLTHRRMRLGREEDIGADGNHQRVRLDTLQRLGNRTATARNIVRVDSLA